MPEKKCLSIWVMICVILFVSLTIDVVSFHWFRTFSLWGVNKYYRKFHSFSWLENISNHHWLSLSCSPCALTALEYAWYWHFNCFFCILFFYRSSPRLSNLLCQGCYFVGSALQFYSFTFSHLGGIPHPFSCYQETHLVSNLVWKVRRHMISKHDTVCLVTLISGFSLNWQNSDQEDILDLAWALPQSAPQYLKPFVLLFISGGFQSFKRNLSAESRIRICTS